MKNRALILVHGRGGTGEQMRSWLTGHIALPDDLLVFAPQAPGNAWYPYRFIEPKAKNEPYLSDSLGLLDTLVSECDAQGIPAEQIIFFGFSQGACLISEYLKQHPQRYGGATIASGGVIGTDAEALVLGGAGSLGKTPVYLGCDHNDPHIPESRVIVTGDLFKKLDGDIEMHLYDDLGHAVHPDALTFLSTHLKA